MAGQPGSAAEARVVPDQCSIEPAVRAVAELTAGPEGAGHLSCRGAGGAAGSGQLARLARAWGVRWPVVRALNRLCTVQAKVHSAADLALPRMDSCRNPMLCLMWPWGVSAMWPRWR